MMDGRHVTYLEGFHDGKHGLIGDTNDHEEITEAYRKRREWLSEMVGASEGDE